MKNTLSEKTTIDSLYIMIRYNRCEVDYKIGAPYSKIYLDTGEIDTEIEKRETICKNISTGIIKVGTHNIPNTGKFITVTVSAKILGKRYFEGITKENIHIVYEEIMKLKIFKCSIGAFKEALVNDIDICKTMVQKNGFLKMIGIIKNMARENERFIRIWKKEDNQGIEFNRRGKETIGKPYIKIYHKGIELENRVRVFKEIYLKEYETKNLIRIEATIKNGKHIKAYAEKGIIQKFRTLEELLEIKQKELTEVIKYNMEQYIKNTIMTEPKEKEGITGREEIVKYLITKIIEKDTIGENQLIEESINTIIRENKNVQKNERYKGRKWMKNIIQELREDDKEFREKLQGNEGLKNLMEKIGIKI